MKTKTANFRKPLERIRRIAECDDADVALIALEKMLVTWPDHPALLIEKSRLVQLSEYGELTEAKNALKRAAEFDPSSPSPWIELGFYRLNIDDCPKDAIKKFDHAIQLAMQSLAEAVAGKIGAVLDSSPADRSAQSKDLQALARFVSNRYGKVAPLAIRHLRERIADFEDLAGPKSERNGK